MINTKRLLVAAILSLSAGLVYAEQVNKCPDMYSIAHEYESLKVTKLEKTWLAYITSQFGTNQQWEFAIDDNLLSTDKYDEERALGFAKMALTFPETPLYSQPIKFKEITVCKYQWNGSTWMAVTPAQDKITMKSLLDLVQVLR